MYKYNEIEKYFEKIQEISSKKKFEIHNPNKKEILAIFKIIKKFISTNNRKIYGGTALNELLKKKGDKGIYKEDIDTSEDIKDIEFYSSTPKADLHKLCDDIYDAGYEYVSGYEATNSETYSISYYRTQIADIAYLPKNVYNHVPYTNIDGLSYVDPLYAMIDIYRQRSDPTNSFYKLPKFMERFNKLIKNYPLPKETCKYTYSLKDEQKKLLKKIKEKVLKGNTEVILIGIYAVNYYIKRSKVANVKNFPMNYFEVVTENVQDTIDKCKKVLKGKDIVTQEYVKLRNAYGHSVFISIKDGNKELPLIRIYKNRDRCIPYKKIHKKKYNIGSYDHIISFWLMRWFREKIDKEKNKISLCIINVLEKVRKEYLEKKKLLGIEGGIFQILATNCLGKNEDTITDGFLKRSIRKKEHKTIIYRYDPRFGKKEAPNFIYENSSGNKVLKEENNKYK